MDKFFSEIHTNRNSKAGQTEPQVSPPTETKPGKKSLPKGVVLGKDGKPCRSCTSFAAWAQMKKAEDPPSARPAPQTSNIAATATDDALPSHCPPDVETLGRSTWTFLHTLSASYPSTATNSQQSDMKQFLGLFSKLYPCWHCAEDFQAWLKRPGNEPRVGGQEDLGRWMCEAHNEVNRKLGKKDFDCNFWKERWKDGPQDGSCG